MYERNDEIMKIKAPKYAYHNGGKYHLPSNLDCRNTTCNKRFFTDIKTWTNKRKLISKLTPEERCQKCFKPFIIEELPPDKYEGYDEEKLQKYIRGDE